MRFSFSLVKDANGNLSWSTDAGVFGEVTNAEVALALMVVAGKCAETPAAIVPTAAEKLAARMAPPPAPLGLPAGWSPSLDGANTTLVLGGGTTYSKRFLRDDGADVEAPVGPNEAVLPETVAALAAYDAEHPRAPTPPPTPEA